MTNMTADLETAFFTAAGGARNQDRAAVFTRPWGTVIVVADGAGGTAGGELAAESAIDHLANVSARSSLPLDEAQFVDALESIDARLLRSAHGGQTTCVVAQVVHGEVMGASVGDSGAWLVSPRGIVDLTTRQSRKPLLGAGAVAPMSFGPVALDGHLVVATDGLLKYATRKAVLDVAAATDLQHGADLLGAAVRLRGAAYPDDVTFILARRI